MTPVLERCIAGCRCLAPVWLAVALILVSHATSGCTRKDENAAAGHSEPDKQQLGERLYREGILASGQPIRAVVAGDIRVEGAMFACANCHLRSGLGTTEGPIITPRINAATLFAPLPRGVPWSGPSFSTAEKPVWETPPPWFDAGFLRDAYDREGLAKVIRTGTNAVGQTLDDAMPRFDLEDGDMTALLDYLGQLSAKYSPGLTETRLSFATVVTDEVPRAEREAMLRALQAYIDTRNAKPRHQKKRARAGPFYRREGDIAYRDIELVTWELTGPPETWRSQLERHYREHPVFALLGGITTGPWSPVHAFCEENRIPSLFPITDQPVVSDTDWYTLYLSKGVHQEGEGAARWLRRVEGLDADARIVQLYRAGGREEIVARAFEATWTELGRAAPGSQILPTGEKEASAFLDALLKDQRPQVLMLWVGADAAPLLEDLARRPDPTRDGRGSRGPPRRGSVGRAGSGSRVHLRHVSLQPSRHQAEGGDCSEALARRKEDTGDEPALAGQHLLPRLDAVRGPPRHAKRILPRVLHGDDGHDDGPGLGGRRLSASELRAWPAIRLERLLRRPARPRSNSRAAAGERLGRSVAEVGSHRHQRLSSCSLPWQSPAQRPVVGL